MTTAAESTSWPSSTVPTSTGHANGERHLHTAVRTASDAAGHKHLNVVSAHTARQCLADGLLDEILVPIPAVAFTFVAPHAEKTDELHRESPPVPAACR
jgi:hypothetical protein